MDGGPHDQSASTATKLHEVFFMCLQASPTYLMAHKLATGEARSLPKRLYHRFEQAERTYKLCGSVYGIDFTDWWDARGARAFSAAAPGKPLSLARTRITVGSARGHLVDLQHWARMRKLAAPGRPWVLNPKRIRRPSETKERPPRAPSIRLFQLAVRLGHADAWENELSFAERDQIFRLPSRRAELAKRFEASLKQGARLVENAARGRFPSYADLTGAWPLVKKMRPEMNVVLRTELRRFLEAMRREHDELYPDTPFVMFDEPGWDVMAVLDLCGVTFDEVKDGPLGFTDYQWKRQLRNKRRLQRLQAEIPAETQEYLKRVIMNLRAEQEEETPRAAEKR